MQFKLEKRGKEAVWKRLGCSPLTDGLAGLREAEAYFRDGSSPSIKGPIRIRAIPQQTNTKTYAKTLTQGKRERPHGNSALFILF